MIIFELHINEHPNVSIAEKSPESELDRVIETVNVNQLLSLATISTRRPFKKKSYNGRDRGCAYN